MRSPIYLYLTAISKYLTSVSKYHTAVSNYLRSLPPPEPRPPPELRPTEPRPLTGRNPITRPHRNNSGGPRDNFGSSIPQKSCKMNEATLRYNNVA